MKRLDTDYSKFEGALAEADADEAVVPGGDGGHLITGEQEGNSLGGLKLEWTSTAGHATSNAAVRKALVGLTGLHDDSEEIKADDLRTSSPFDGLTSGEGHLFYSINTFYFVYEGYKSAAAANLWSLL